MFCHCLLFGERVGSQLVCDELMGKKICAFDHFTWVSLFWIQSLAHPLNQPEASESLISINTYNLVGQLFDLSNLISCFVGQDDFSKNYQFSQKEWNAAKKSTRVSVPAVFFLLPDLETRGKCFRSL